MEQKLDACLVSAYCVPGSMPSALSQLSSYLTPLPTHEVELVTAPLFTGGDTEALRVAADLRTAKRGAGLSALQPEGCTPPHLTSTWEPRSPLKEQVEAGRKQRALPAAVRPCDEAAFQP